MTQPGTPQIIFVLEDKEMSRNKAICMLFPSWQIDEGVAVENIIQLLFHAGADR